METGVNEILVKFWPYYLWLFVFGVAYSIILHFWKKHFPEIFDIFETLIVFIWAAGSLLIISGIVAPTYWYRVVVALSVSAVPIVIFSLVSKGNHYRRILGGLEDAKTKK